MNQVENRWGCLGTIPNLLLHVCSSFCFFFAVETVLAEYLDNQKKREGKDNIETFLNLVEFTLLNQITPI